MFCPKCGTENNNSATFCGNCGSSLKKNAPVDKQGSGKSKNTCESCGAILTGTAKFCKICGVKKSTELPQVTTFVQPPGSPRNYKPFIAIGALLISVAVALGIIFLTRTGNDDNNQQSKTVISKITNIETAPTQTIKTTSRTNTSTSTTIASPNGSFSVAGPTDEQMKNDLLGERLSSDSSGTGLKFEALREFQEFNVVNRIENGSSLEYSVSITLKDFGTNINYLADVLIIYKLTGNNYQFVSVTGDYHKI
ncbi:MAG: zinc ribbon domain-containing protein [Thermoleophilia bacterium]